MSEPSTAASRPGSPEPESSSPSPADEEPPAPSFYYLESDGWVSLGRDGWELTCALFDAGRNALRGSLRRRLRFISRWLPWV